MKRILSVFLCGIMLLCLSACGENTHSDTQPNESAKQSDTNNQETEIFNTKNIKRITFYGYYGNGKGSDVPVEHLDEIKTWLNSFTIDTDREFPDLVPPGTNTIYVEIEYSDGSIVKCGMDAVSMNGTTRYIKGDTPPECFKEILSKTSLE